MAFASRATSGRGIRDRLAITRWGRRPPPATLTAQPVSSLVSGVAAVAGGTPTITPSISPAPNTTLVLWVGHAVSGGTTITGVTGLGLTWTQAGTVNVSASTKLDCWTAVCGATPGSGPVTITTGVAASVCYDIDQVIGANASAPLVASNTKSATGTGTATAITFNTPAVGDLLMFCAAMSSFGTQTPNAGWPELADQAQSGPSVSIASQVSPASPGTAGGSTLSLSATWAALGIELNFGLGATLAPAGQAHTRNQGALTVSPGLLPAGLVRTRAQGALVVSPQLKPAGQAHTRAQGALTVSTAGTIPVAGIAHTRAQGNPTLSPQLHPAGQTHTRQLGSVTIPGVTVRQLGALIVTVAYHPRPAGLIHARALGATVVTGRDLQPLGIRHTRAQGNPTLSARALPAGITHARAQGAPSVNRLTLAPSGLIHAGASPQLTLTPVATDSFNRANATIAGANNWLASSTGSMAVSSNEAIGAASVVHGNYRTDTYNTNHYSQCTVGSVAVPVGGFIGPTVRNTTNQDCYSAFYYQSSAGNWEIDLYKLIAGSFTQLFGTSGTGALPGALAQGTTLTLIAEGSQITLQINGTTFCSIIDTSIASGGTPGIISFNPGTLDNWEGGNAQTATIGAAVTTDNFNRANNGMSVSQANWQIMTGYPAVDIPIAGNQLNPTTGSHAADVRTDLAYTPDQWAAIQMGTTPMNSTGFVGTLTRVNPGLNSGYLGILFQNTYYRIYRLDAGTSTLLASVATPGSDPAGTTYTLVSSGTRHSLRVNDHEVTAATDATYTTGQPGIMLFPACTADNWSAGNVPSAGRALGTPGITTVEILRPTGQAHTRAQGAAVAHGHLTLAPTGLPRTRAQGNPTLSARALPAGLAHTRNLGSPAVNTRTLAPPALARA